ncbi:DUF3466 family protein [Parashewanella spongiae]|uniref:DUF3466 family protein n=1 Tax=Parashewanella spongiae TaxID=342950 RepID=A0A3A6U5F8_9GAMM|nr:DUF3466 family protein [Parashewanella spongiae]MCL1076878.1 DUF3466 family protein [Parashewanella spongiae]RJY19245.1 DUF3466 family protein [Parashewanella spongiae]
MKLTLDKALSAVAVSVIGALGTAVAAPVYEIVNLDDYDFIGEGRGTLENTRSGYAQSINANNELVGIAQGRKKLSAEDIDVDIIDVEDGIAPSERITFSINSPIVANTFGFVASTVWIPTFESVNGSTDPKDSSVTNSVDSQFFGINDAGIKVGNMTAPEDRITYTGTTENQEFWYIRAYEQRGIAKRGDTELPLLPPYHTYTNSDGEAAEIGGYAGATAINNHNLIVGYASTDIADPSKARIDTCIDSTTTPTDVCIQEQQFPSSQGSRNINYQVRGYLWQLNSDDTVTGTLLPLGLTPEADSTVTYSAQALGVNNAGVVVGRSNTYRNGDKDRLRDDAAYWTKNSSGEYQYNWVPSVNEEEDINSIAYDINDNGILVGSYRSFIDGFQRDKFFYFDTNSSGGSVVVPNDFFDQLSDFASRGRSINNKDQVVGYIETTQDKNTARPKAGFLFDKSSEEFSNLNDLLTCESKGYIVSGSETRRNEVTVVDGSGKELVYESDIVVADAASINEDGTIVGTALIRKPVYQVDADGNPVLDENSNLPLFELNANGQPVTSSLPRMVVLQLTGDDVQAGEKACTFTDKVDEKPYERKGGGMLTWLFALPLLFIRRRKVH